MRADASVVVKPPRALRGEDKLRAALDGFAIDVTDRECVDLGASAGGFTRVLLEHGARRVFAVDAGHGQLRGELRNHSRVVNLERTNLADLSAIPRCAPIGAVTMDLSYLSVADAVPQIEALSFAPDADLIALVKPMFELGLDSPPEDDPSLRRALDLAVAGRGATPRGTSSERCRRPSPGRRARANGSCTHAAPRATIRSPAEAHSTRAG